MNKEQTKNNPTEKQAPAMTPEAFALWGVGQIAYIKPMTVGGQSVAAIFSADGQQIGLSATAEIARAAAIQHSLEPMSVH